MAAYAARCGGLRALADLSSHLAASVSEGHVIASEAVGRLLAATGLPTVEALMLALLPTAQALARPVISGFRVGAVGREGPGGALVLGANVEFRGAPMADTIHAEQFLFSRAYHRAASLDLIAVSARPCGHCRQFMAEFAGRESLVILGPDGDRLSLADMLPWSFTPADLGEAGAQAGACSPLDVEDDDAVAADLRAALGAAGGRAYAPYSRSPSAVALRLGDGHIVSGSAIENAAYNPGLPPLQAALINLVAAGEEYGAIREAVIVSAGGGAVSHTASTRRLLGCIAPGARVEARFWRSAAST